MDGVASVPTGRCISSDINRGFGGSNERRAHNGLTPRRDHPNYVGIVYSPFASDMCTKGSQVPADAHVWRRIGAQGARCAG